MGNKILRPDQDNPLAGFNEDQLQYLAEKFQLLQNQKGFLDTDKVTQIYKCSKEEAELLIKFIDNQQNGAIDFYQFKCAAASLHQDDEEAQRMIHQIYSENGEIKPSHFNMLYKTIFSYLKEMNILSEKQEYKDQIGQTKFKQYDYSKNGFLDQKQFSEMIRNDYHCKAWMEILGFNKGNITIPEKPEKPENDAQDFAEDENAGDEAGSTPAWIKTIQYMAPTNSKVPSDHNQTPSNNIEIQYVYGYRSYDTRDNLKYNPNGQAVYHTAALGIVLNQSKNTMRTMDIHNDDITCLDVKDQITVTGEMGRKPLIVVWNNQTMQKIVTFSTPLQNSIACIAISPSKKYIAASSMSDKHQIAIYNLESKSLVATGNGPRSVIYALKFNSNEDMVVAACAKEVVFAQFKGGKFKLVKGVFGKIPILASFSLASHPSGMISGMQNGSILMWKGTSCSKPYKQHNTAVSALCETQKGGVVSGDVQGNIIIWTNSLTVQRKFSVSKLLNKTTSNNPKVIALCLKGSNLLVGTRGGQIIQCDISKNPVTGSIIMQGHYDKQLWGVASASKTNEFFTGGQDKLLLKWDIAKRKLSAKRKCEYQIMSLDYNSKSNLLAVGMKNGIVQFFDAATLKPASTKIVNFKNPDKEVLSIVKYSPDCSLLAVGYCPPVSKVFFYKTDNNKKVGECKNCLSRITSIDFTTDGDSIMLNNTSYEILFFQTNGSQITTAKSFKPNSWNEDRWATLSCKYSWQAQGIWPHLYADGTNINAVERSHNGKLLATGDDFSKIKLFKYPACVSKQFYNIYKGHSSHITGIKWSFNDEYMISIGGLEKSIIQWKMDVNEEIAYEYQQENHLEPQEQPIQQDQQYQFEGEPPSDIKKEKKQKSENQDDDFEQEENQGDEALAIKPFQGQVIASTPAAYTKPVLQQYNVLPSQSLQLKYAWGIRNQYISDEVRNQLKYSQNSKSCVYFTAALGVQMNFKDHSQTFYNVQSEDLVSMSITPDRKIVATGQMAQVDKNNKKVPKVDIHIWQVEGKKQIISLKGFHQRAIVILEFSPDGTQLLSIGQDEKNTLAVYNWKNAKITWSAPTSKGKATGACWKNNKEYCTIGTDHIKFWTEAKGTMGKIPGKWEAMYSVAFLQGAKYVSGGSSGNLFLWTGGTATKVQAHKGKVHSIKVDKGKIIYSGAEDGKIICWKFNGNQISKQSQIANLSKVSPLAPGILSIDVHPSQQRMLICTKSSQIYEFPISKFEDNQCHMAAHYAGQLWCCSFSPNNAQFVTGGDDKTVRIYDTSTYKQKHLTKTSNIVRAVDWCKANAQLIVVGDWKGNIFLYDSELNELDQGKTRFSKMKPMQSTYWIQDIKFSPDGNSVAFGAHGGRSHIQVFQIEGKKFGKSKVLNVGFTSALLSLDWNISSSVVAAVSQAYQFKFANVNPSDPKFADVSARSMKDQKWASWTNKFGWMVQGIFQQVQYFSIHSVCRDPNEKLIATGGTDQKVKLLKYPVIAPKQKSKQYIGHSSHVTRVRFSQDQDYLLSTGGNDRTTLLWDVIRPNKQKKVVKQQSQESQEQQVEDEQKQEQQEGDTNESVVKDFDDDIDIPARAVKQEQKIQKEDDDQFEEQENEGDEFMAVLPFKGALIAPTINYQETTGKPPKVKISIQYAYGYRTKDCRNNLKFLTKQTISYHTAALGVIMDISSQPQTQKFFNKHTDDILSMCWSPDKNSLFTGQQGAKCPVHEWDVQGNFIRTYTGMIKGIVALACNEKYVAAAGMDDDHIIIIFDRKTGLKYATQKGGKEFIVALDFIDDQTLVSIGIKHYSIWTIEGKKLKGKKGNFKRNNNLLTCVKVRDKKILVGAGDGSLQIWQDTGIMQTIKNLHNGKPLEAICSLQNVIITGGKDKKINILDEKFKIISSINCQELLQGSINCMVRAIDVLDNRILIGTIASEIFQVQCSENINQCSADSKFKLIKMRMSGHYAANAKWTNEVWGLSLMQRDDEFVTCSDDATVRVWNMSKREQVMTQRLDLDLKNKPIPKNKLTGDYQEQAKGRCIAVSQDKYVLVGCKQGTVRVFNPNLKQINIIKVTNKEISDIKFSADNSLIGIGTHDSKIYIYKWQGNGKMKLGCKMIGHHSTITHIDFSQDGNYLHSNSRDYELLFWQTNSGKQLTSGATMLRDQFFHTWTSCIGWPVEGIWQKFTKGSDINAVDRTKEGNPYQGKTLLCVGDDFGKVRLLQYPVRTKNSQSVDGSGHSSHVTCVRFNNNDQRVISTGGEDHTIIQWKIQR